MTGYVCVDCGARVNAKGRDERGRKYCEANASGAHNFPVPVQDAMVGEHGEIQDTMFDYEG